MSDGLNSGSYASGGYVLSALAGVELTIKQVSFGANIQAPMAQEIAANQTRLNIKGMMHVTFAF